MRFSFLFCKCFAWALSPEDLDISNQDLTLSVLVRQSVRSDPLRSIQLRQRRKHSSGNPAAFSRFTGTIYFEF